MIDLILSTGSNLENRATFLKNAYHDLKKEFYLIEKSNVYESIAVDYKDQPNFLNQILHFQIEQNTSPLEVLNIILSIENLNGRVRKINKGPRTLDIDILFYGIHQITTPKLTIPHPRLFERSFIVTPLKELKIFNFLEQHFSFRKELRNSCSLTSILI